MQSARRGDTPALEALPALEETIDRATVLANQMLSLAKIEQLRQSGQFEPVEWSAVLRDLALEMAPLVADKDIDFGLDSQPCTVLAHPWMLREISRNLLHNAIRHTPAGGKLDVRLHPAQGMAQLEILDSGEGIPDELRPRLFQPFSTADQRYGSGLGLTIAREMVSTLGGSIHLDNRVDTHGHCTGLTAYVELPLGYDQPA